MKAKLFYPILSLFISFSTVAQQPDIASMMANRVDASTVADSYAFSWKYTMAITTDKGQKMNADYLLEPNSKYFGMKTSQAGNDMTMIVDTDRKINVMGIGTGGQKMGMATKMTDYAAAAEKAKSDHAFTYKTLPDKTILGYKCKGVEATSQDHVMQFYFTNDAPVNFADLFKSPAAKQIPDAFSSYFKPGEKPLLMQIEMTDKTKGTKMSMECTALKKEPFVFQKSDYRFM